MKVAIVENESEQAELLAGYVKRYAAESGVNCTAVIYPNGLDFISEYTGDFDAVFMDIKMPLMGGLTAAEKLRETDEHVPLVFVTNMAQFAIKGYKVGALDFLVKPVGYFDFSLELRKIARLKERSAGDFMWLTAAGALRRVPITEISYIEILNHNVGVHTDVHFIPVNYPPEEADALNVSIVGFVFYGISVIAMIAASFFARLTKSEA